MFGIVAICDLSHISAAFRLWNNIPTLFILILNGMIDWLTLLFSFLEDREPEVWEKLGLPKGHTEEKNRSRDEIQNSSVTFQTYSIKIYF